MRIIDKNNDYYDYLQDREDNLVFDRRGSFILTKDLFCEGLRYVRYNKDNYRFVVLQCGATFWLFLATVTKFKDLYSVVDYNLELLTSWKDYTKPRAIIDLKMVYLTSYWLSDLRKYEFIKSHLNEIQQSITNGEYILCRQINEYVKYTGTATTKSSYKKELLTIPILKACGISEFIDPETMYHAIDEYFSLEKMDMEKTEAEGTTNKDKIVNHGFDTKISFRGKPNAEN